jgi:hypothetical protein
MQIPAWHQDTRRELKHDDSGVVSPSGSARLAPLVGRWGRGSRLVQSSPEVCVTGAVSISARQSIDGRYRMSGSPKGRSSGLARRVSVARSHSADSKGTTLGMGFLRLRTAFWLSGWAAWGGDDGFPRWRSGSSTHEDGRGSNLKERPSQASTPDHSDFDGHTGDESRGDAGRSPPSTEANHLLGGEGAQASGAGDS